MENYQDNVAELRKYYSKLYKYLRDCSGLSFAGTKVVDKRKVDDILVCIEASYPSCYKKFLDLYGGSNIASKKFYDLLMSAIKNKFLFSSSSYAVKINEALTYIDKIKVSLPADFKYIEENYSAN